MSEVKNIPDGWAETALGELYDVSSGLSKSKESFGFGETFISFKDVFNNWFIPNKPEGLVNSNDKDQQSCSVKKGDILITRTSETNEEIGMSSVALKDYPKSTFNGFCKRLRPKVKPVFHVYPLFIGYLLRSLYFRRTVAQFATMTTRASLNGDSIKKIKLVFPSYDEQVQIGLTLRSFDNKIELLQAQNKTLEETIQTIFTEWFGKYQIEDELPGGWRIEKLGEVIKIKQGKYINSEELSEVRNDKFNYSVYGGGGVRGYSNKFIYKTPQVVLTCRGNGCGRIQLSENNSTITNSCMALEDQDSELNFNYIYFLSKKINFESVISGSAQPQITVTNLEGIEVIVPEKKYLRKFNTISTNIFDKIFANNLQIQTLTLTRDELLPRLMSGEVRVNEFNV